MKKVVGHHLGCSRLLLNVAVKTTAQQPTKVPRIGYYVFPPFRYVDPHRGIPTVCASLGTGGEKHCMSGVLRRRKRDRLSSLAAELVRLK